MMSATFLSSNSSTGCGHPRHRVLPVHSPSFYLLASESTSHAYTPCQQDTKTISSISSSAAQSPLCPPSPSTVSSSIREPRTSSRGEKYQLRRGHMCAEKEDCRETGRSGRASRVLSCVLDEETPFPPTSSVTSPSSDTSATLGDKEIVGEAVHELECLLDLDEQCQQAAKHLKLEQLILMRERNAYLEKLGEIERFCEAKDWKDNQHEEQELLDLLKEILYSEDAEPV